mgnify:CR=1 FL=1
MHQTDPTHINFDDLSDESHAEHRSKFDALPNDALIRLKDLLEFNVIPFSSTTIWRKIKARTFPEPEKISANIVAFRCREIREWSRDPSNYVVNQTKKLNKPNTQQEQRNEK